MRAFDSSRLPRPHIEFNLQQLAQHTHLDLEIGAGQGFHAVQYCRANPARHLLAVERTHQRFAKLLHRKTHHPELRNLSVLHADAVAFVTHYLPDRCLDRVFLLYPNPYPKKSQANLRWHKSPFIAMLKQKMKLGAELELATNIESYATDAQSEFVDVWNMPLIQACEVQVGAPPRTHFEKKYLLRGDRCWNLIFQNPL